MGQQFAIKVKGRGYYCGSKRVDARVWTEYEDPKFKQYLKKPEPTRWNPAVSNGEWSWSSTDKLIFKRNLSDLPKEYKFDSPAEVVELIKVIKEMPNLKIMTVSFRSRGVRVYPKLPLDDKDIKRVDNTLNNLEVVKLEAVDFPKRVLKSKQNCHVQNSLKLEKHNGSAVRYCRKCGSNILEGEDFALLYNWDVCVHCLHEFAQDVERAYEATPKENKEAYLNARMLDAL